MANPVLCGRCGARNPSEVEWCGQCFASLEADRGLRGATTASVPEAPADGQVSPTWRCTVCETTNPLDSSVCRVCGTSIFEALGADGHSPREVDPRAALTRSLVAPGLGHLAVRQGLLGASIAGLVLISALFGVALVVSGLGTHGYLLILVAAAVWLLSALDAFRWAQGQSDEVLLRPRVLTALVALVVGVVIVAVIAVQGGAT